MSSNRPSYNHIYKAVVSFVVLLCCIENNFSLGKISQSDQRDSMMLPGGEANGIISVARSMKGWRQHHYCGVKVHQWGKIKAMVSEFVEDGETVLLMDRICSDVLRAMLRRD